MTSPEPARSVLTLSCRDRPGIVHAVSRLLLTHACTIAESQQFSDPEAVDALQSQLADEVGPAEGCLVINWERMEGVKAMALGILKQTVERFTAHGGCVRHCFAQAQAVHQSGPPVAPELRRMEQRFPSAKTRRCACS